MVVRKHIAFGVDQFGRHVSHRTAGAGLRRRVNAIEVVHESCHAEVAEFGTPVLVNEDIGLQV